MRLYLIRHAQSENNALTGETMRQRKADPDLTALGYRQRDLLARFLASAPGAAGEGFAITRLYTSAMLRSLLTAQPIAEALGLQPKVWLELHEMGGMFLRRDGRLDGCPGLTRSAIQDAFPGYQLPATVTESGWYDASLGFEPDTRSLYRAIQVAKRIGEWRESGEVIALVSHAGFLDILLKAICAQLPTQPGSMRYYHNNTAITRVDYHASGPALHYLNRVDHLPAELRSH